MKPRWKLDVESYLIALVDRKFVGRSFMILFSMFLVARKGRTTVHWTVAVFCDVFFLVSLFRMLTALLRIPALMALYRRRRCPSKNLILRTLHPILKAVSEPLLYFLSDKSCPKTHERGTDAMFTFSCRTMGFESLVSGDLGMANGISSAPEFLSLTVILFCLCTY